MENNPHKKVLLVDDEEDFCEIVCRILYKEGYEVVCAPSLKIATEELTHYNPHIILLDHNLPDGFGISFLENNKEALNDKQVIFITANSSRALIEKAISLGAFHFLSKPFSSSTLSRAVSQAEQSG